MKPRILTNYWLWLIWLGTAVVAVVGFFVVRAKLPVSELLVRELQQAELIKSSDDVMHSPLAGLGVLVLVVAGWFAIVLAVSFVGSFASLFSGADRFMLVTKYLRRKLAPMFAALAVTLCTAMVIIVISVMGGFLQMWRDSAKRLSGEIMISAGLTGFGHYENILADIRKLPEVESATAVINTFGIIRINNVVKPIEIVGVKPEELSAVVAYRESLYWTADSMARDRAKYAAYRKAPVDLIRPQARYLDAIEVAGNRDISYVAENGAKVSITTRDKSRHLTVLDAAGKSLFDGPVETDAQRAQIPFDVRVLLNFQRELANQDLVAAGMTLKPPAQWQSNLDGLVAGIGVHAGGRDGDGDFSLYTKTMPAPNDNRQRWEQHEKITAAILDAVRAKTGEPQLNIGDRNPLYRPAPVWYVPGNTLPGGEVTLTVVPLTDKGVALSQSVRRFAVVNEIKSGFFEYDTKRVFIPFAALQEMLEMQSYDVVDQNTGLPTGEKSPARATAILVRGKPGVDLQLLKYQVDAVAQGLFVETWEEQHATMLGAVENEKGLLVFLFAIISVVAFVMVATTFYNIVLEKTRDIGVLRALGPSQLGVAGLFLGYGLTIGVVGAASGLLLAWLIVGHLNDIHHLLEQRTGHAFFLFLAAAIGAGCGGLLQFSLGHPNGRQSPRWRRSLWLIGAMAAAVVGVIALSASPIFARSLQHAMAIKIWDARIYYFERIPAQLNPVEVAVILFCAVLSAVVGALLPAYRAARLDPVEAIRYE